MNEEATRGGKLDDGSRTAKFKSLIKGIPVLIAPSGRTMELDGDADALGTANREAERVSNVGFEPLDDPADPRARA